MDASNLVFRAKYGDDGVLELLGYVRMLINASIVEVGGDENLFQDFTSALSIVHYLHWSNMGRAGTNSCK